MPDAQLVLANGERRTLTTDKPTLIGRHSDCEIVLHDSQVSRRHGRLTQTVHGWHYADLGSRNGSSVNGRPCTETYLAAGDELFIGNAYLIFETLPVREMECA
jgi:pSer/pThr/pTyr-binding forkhead associated (FHA) protein